MKRLGRAVVVGWASGLVAYGCVTEAADPDSETNWLETCDTDEDCKAPSRCLCGLCTIACQDDDACASGPAGSTCTTLPEVCATTETTGSCTIASDGPDSGASDASVAECVAEGTGARLGGRVPDEGDVWVPDLDNPLTREYWRVFQRPSGTAYIIPDPTQAPQQYIPGCAEQGHVLFDIVARYSFCDLTNPDAAQLIDHMTVEDALTVAHFYHQQIEFRCNNPTMFLEDVVDACELSTVDDAPELGAVCDTARAAEQACDADVVIPCDGQAGADLAYLLNQLYGTGATRDTLPIAPELCDTPASTDACTSPEPSYFYDPVTAGCILRPYGSCGDAVRDFPSSEACASACLARAQLCESCDAGGACQRSTDCSVCPLTTPENGTACSEAGFRCDYAGRCGNDCRCTPTDGGMVWHCMARLC